MTNGVSNAVNSAERVSMQERALSLQLSYPRHVIYLAGPRSAALGDQTPFPYHIVTAFTVMGGEGGFTNLLVQNGYTADLEISHK